MVRLLLSVLLTSGAWLLVGLAAAVAGPLLLVTSSRSGNPDLFLIDVESGDAFNLTRHPGIDAYPAISRDGTRIAFASARDRAMQIFIMDADGTNVAPLTSEEAIDRVPTFSPDGKKIAFCRRFVNEAVTNVYVMDADGKNARLIQENAFDPAWSPDGKRIAFTSPRGTGFRVYVMDADGNNVIELTSNANTLGFVYPCWSPDGKQIAYGELVDGQHVEVFRVDADGRNARQLTSLQSLNIYPAWSPDGKRIAFQHHDPNGVPGPVYLMDADGGNAAIIPVLRSERYVEGGRLVWRPE